MLSVLYLTLDNSLKASCDMRKNQLRSEGISNIVKGRFLLNKNVQFVKCVLGLHFTLWWYPVAMDTFVTVSEGDTHT